MYVPGKPFQPSLMFAGKAGAYPSEAPFRCSSLGSYPRLWALPTNIRLGWNGLKGTNTLAYYENSQITDAKSLITLVPGFASSNLFNFSKFTRQRNKLVRFRPRTLWSQFYISASYILAQPISIHYTVGRLFV